MASKASPSGNNALDEFYALLAKLLQAFYAKDAYGFFYEPVDTSIVTDYAAIIKNPMDFGTMSSKITKHQYRSLREFQSDFELICSNCMIYNAPNTVYYKTAQKLLHFGRKVIAKEAQKASALLILASASQDANGPEGLGGLGAMLDASTSGSSLASLKRKAELALFKKLHDGSSLFSSLKRYRGPVSFPTLADGSLDLRDYPDLQQLMLMPLSVALTADSTTSLAKLGSTWNILGAFVTRSQKPFLPSSTFVPGSLHFASPRPFYSFCPFYDSQGFPIAAFDSVGLSLVYGDPKGRAYIESLERFMQGISGNNELLAELSCDGHAYLKHVYQWRHSVKQASVVKDPEKQEPRDEPNSNLKDSKVPRDANDAKDTKALVDGGPVEPDVLEADPTSSTILSQVKSDLNLLARVLRWKKVEPEIERMHKMPSLPFIKQFQQQVLQTVKAPSPSPPPLPNVVHSDATGLDSTELMLLAVSKLLLRLQAYQNDRFKTGKPAAVSIEERNLGTPTFL